MRKLFVVALGLSITSIGVVWATQKVDDPKTPPVAKAAIKKDEPKQDQPAKPTVEWSKPKMVNFYELLGPPEKLLWGASEKKPYLFVEYSLPAGTDRPAALDNRVAVIRPGDEKTVTETILQRNHHLAAVYKNESAFASVRFDVGGINALRELRYFVSKAGLDVVIDSLGPPIVDPKTKQQWYSRNDFTPRLNLNESTKQAVSYTTQLDSDCLRLFQLTPDGKGIWNVYTEANEQGDAVRYGLRLLDPVTSKVLKKLPSVPCGLSPSMDCKFDLSGQYAVMGISQMQTVQRDEMEENANTITCWDLTKGTISWTVTPPKDLVPYSVAIAGDGKTVAISYQVQRYVDVIADYLSRKSQEPGASKEKQLDKEFEAHPVPRVHFHDTTSGKQTGELLLDRYVCDTHLLLSPHAELVVVQSMVVNAPNWNAKQHRTQVVDVASRKVVQTWNNSYAKFAFSPKNDGDYPILAIAEDVDRSTGNVGAFIMDRTGRLGLWRFECSRVEEKK